jgi:peptide/nickel transport system substrate-binding protein
VRRALLLTAALVCALAGCTRAGGGPAPTAGDAGVLRLVAPTDLPGWNNLVLDNTEVGMFSEFVHGYLLRADGDGRLVPDLATAVPTLANGGISPDGRTVTYHLRRNARWHDGAPFDARDVVFSFSAAMNPNNAVPDRTGFDHVAAVKALDAYTVRVKLTRAFAPFVASAFTLGANDPYPVLPAHLLAGKHDLNRDAYNAAPVGLGPYKLARWERGSRIVLTADPHYFRGVAPIRRIDVAIVPDPNTVATLWQAGKLDLVIGRVQTGRTFLDRLRGVPGAHVVLQPHYEFDFLAMNQGRPPLDDARVRRAIVQAVDRARIMRDLDGELWVPGETDRLAGQFAYDATLAQPRYDPAAAARALEAAGWRLQRDGSRRKNGRTLNLDFVATTESPTTARFAILAQQDLDKVGVRSDVKAYAYNQIWAGAAEHGIYKDGRFDLTYTGWQPNAVNDHSYLFRCDTRPPAGDNFARICDPAIETAARQELGTADPVREAAGDRALTRRLVERTDLLFLGFNREAVAYRDGLEGVKPSVLGEHYWNPWEWRLRRP